MNLLVSSMFPDTSSIPRASGGEPESQLMGDLDLMVFPARAGVNLQRDNVSLIDISIPRGCGSEPERK